MKNSSLRTNEELSQIYERHVNTVYRVCFLMMKNRHDAEDMVQNTFIRLISDGTRFQNSEHEKAWLIKTAVNLCRDHYRSWWKKAVNIGYVRDTAFEQSFETDETLEKVMALPPKYKTAIFMYYYEGYSTVEMAKLLSKNESTVRSYLHTGRKLLKLELEAEKMKSGG